MTSVLIIDDDPSTLRLIGFTLERGGFQVISSGDGEDGLAKAFQQPPDLVIADVMMPGLSGYQVCEQLRADVRTAHVPIIILTARSQAVDQKTALEAGADLYLAKPVTPDELIGAVEELLSRPTDVPPPAAAKILAGRTISVFSLRGGVGVTSVAVNLAVALAQQYQDTVPLVDLSLSAGHAAIMLNLHPKRTIAHLLAGQVDFETIEKHLLPHPSGVRLLAAPPVPPPPGAIPADAIERLLIALKPHYSYIVVDTNSSLDDVTMSALHASDTILLLFSPEVLSVQTTLTTRQALRARGIAPEKVLLVLNQTMPKPGLPLKMIENALKQPVKMMLPYESKQVQAVAMGQPLMISDPALPLASAIRAMSSAVSVTKAT
jgi:pilus assembly protein CpaE